MDSQLSFAQKIMQKSLKLSEKTFVTSQHILFFFFLQKNPRSGNNRSHPLLGIVHKSRDTRGVGVKEILKKGHWEFYCQGIY